MKNYNEHLLPAHGGYCKLVTYKLGSLIYDATAAFCEHFIDHKDRTFDQMVQAARSGVANIVEGSEASAASKKTELKLTNVARASLEELKLDYEDFLRQNHLTQWTHNDRKAENLISQRFQTAEEIRSWINYQAAVCKQNGILCPTREIAANAILLLIKVTSSLLDRQLTRLASDFTQNGGFTERLYAVRKRNRSNGQ